MERSTLKKGDSLKRGERLSSPNLRYRLVLQDDGNLVLYRQDAVDFWQWLWDTNSRAYVQFSAGKNYPDVASVQLQQNGNLAGLDSAGQSVWISDFLPKGGETLQVQDDGNVVIYNSAGQSIWSVQKGENENISIASNASNPLKLDDAWYCNCINNGEAILKSTQGLAKKPTVKAILVSRGLNSFLEGLYPSPYCGVPTLEQLQQEATDRAFAYNCPGLWSASKCDNYRNGLREQYLAEALTNHDRMCQDAARNEALLIESIATKAGTAVQGQIVTETLSPEARQEAELAMQQKNKQAGWVVLAIVVGIGVLAWYIWKK